MNYIPFFDGHNDTLTQTLPQKLSQPALLPLGTDKSQIDLQRAQQAHYLGGLFAVFTDADDEDEADSADYRTASNQLIMPPPLDPQLARQRTDAVFAQVLRAERDPQCPWRIARTYAELEQNIKD